ncbi:MAG: four helix bundle protein [Bacteroidales bacterium]|nr:four helix bundle protein [Bacteroidales bacterium]
MKEELKKRTKEFAISVFKLSQGLDHKFRDYQRQLIRCSSSVGANYRAACRAKSSKDFINKIKIVEEELDESLYFIELIPDLSEKPNDLWNKTIRKEINYSLSLSNQSSLYKKIKPRNTKLRNL